MLNQQYALLNSVDSYIEPLLVRVLKTDKFGICYGTVEIDSVSSSCGKTKGDRFKLSIPYAKQNLTWNVLFDSQCPEMGPDFLFNDDTFLANMDIDTLSIYVPSLAEWNPNDKNALVNVLNELLSCYKQYQIQLFQKQNRLGVEYNMLTSMEIESEDIEMILLPLGSKPVEAKFLISLSIDVSQLPNRTCESENDVAMLLVTFCGADWNRIVPQLYFSKFLEEILGGTTSCHLPHFSSDICLVNYVLEIKEYITDKINSLVQSLEKRREFIASVLAFQRNSVIEYDAINHTFITLLLNIDNFSFLLYINFSQGFPRELPTFMLQSVYHMTEQGVPYEEVINFPYNTKWEPVRMVKNLLVHIKQNIGTFIRNSITSCP